MSFLTGLVAVALLGADGSNAEGPSSPIVYEVKILEMRGLSWRGSMQSQIQTVSSQGGATVWIAPGVVGPRLVGICDKVVAAPKVTAAQMSSVAIQDSGHWRVPFDSRAGRRIEVNQASHATITLMDEVHAETRTGLSLKVQGRKLDQGVLASVSISDQQVTALHNVILSGRRAVPAPDASAPMTLPPMIHVPELTQCDVSGEWLIPNNGVLIVSLGVHTFADSGNACVRERLALIQARETTPKPEMRAVYTAPKAPAAAPATKGYLNSPIMVTSTRFPLSAPTVIQPSLPAANAPIPWPEAPSRALPEARDVSGMPIPLPPLPETMPVTKLPGSSEPCATPQIHSPQACPSDDCTSSASTLTTWAAHAAAVHSLAMGTAAKRDAQTAPAAATPAQSGCICCGSLEEADCLDQADSELRRTFQYMRPLSPAESLETIKKFIDQLPKTTTPCVTPESHTPSSDPSEGCAACEPASPAAISAAAIDSQGPGNALMVPRIPSAEYWIDQLIRPGFPDVKRDSQTVPASASIRMPSCCEDEDACCLDETNPQPSRIRVYDTVRTSISEAVTRTDENETESRPRSYRFLVPLSPGINLEIKAFVKSIPRGSEPN